MKLKKHRFLALAILAAVVALQSAACKKPRDPANAAEMKEKLSDKLDFVFWKIDATDEQEARFDKLLDGLAPDLFTFQEESKVVKRGLIRVLSEDEVRLESLLEQQKVGLDIFDRYTRRMSQAAVDASHILTVEQRRELVGMWKEFEFGDDD